MIVLVNHRRINLKDIINNNFRKTCTAGKLLGRGLLKHILVMVSDVLFQLDPVQVLYVHYLKCVGSWIFDLLLFFCLFIFNTDQKNARNVHLFVKRGESWCHLDREPSGADRNKESEMNLGLSLNLHVRTGNESGTVHSHQGIIPSSGTCDMQLEVTARGLPSQIQWHFCHHLQSWWRSRPRWHLGWRHFLTKLQARAFVTWADTGAHIAQDSVFDHLHHHHHHLQHHHPPPHHPHHCHHHMSGMHYRFPPPPEVPVPAVVKLVILAQWRRAHAKRPERAHVTEQRDSTRAPPLLQLRGGSNNSKNPLFPMRDPFSAWPKPSTARPRTQGEGGIARRARL